QFNLLRVPLDAERLGLNIYEHGATTGLMEISDAMREILPPNQGGKGDLTARVHVEMGTEAGDIAMLFNKLVGSYHDTVLDLNMTMQTLQKSISGVRIASHDMQSNMSGQTASTSKVSDTVATMLGAVSNVSRHTTEAEEAALTIKESTSESSKTVHEVISCVDTLATEVAEAGEVIKSLREDIRGIGSISELIRGVSEQTNLLALNAAIEAARAGEHGRGFAVVADEVRGLASRVADSTEEIGKLVKNVESRAEQAVGVIERGSTSASHSASIAGQAGEALDRIQENINEIAKRTSQIKNTVQDHEEVATAVNDQIGVISGSTNQVDALATSTADSSDTLSKVSEGLRQSVAHFVVGASHSASELIHAPAKMEEVDASLPEFNDIKTD
ncbi:MAG: hypothetical protein GY806_10390, partial [Gammaproteobacteria bacterium]|nr:hypothetical protein [Gammaproteobacteria bacterium]